MGGFFLAAGRQRCVEGRRPGVILHAPVRATHRRRSWRTAGGVGAVAAGCRWCWLCRAALPLRWWPLLGGAPGSLRVLRKRLACRSSPCWRGCLLRPGVAARSSTMPCAELAALALAAGMLHPGLLTLPCWRGCLQRLGGAVRVSTLLGVELAAFVRRRNARHGMGGFFLAVGGGQHRCVEGRRPGVILHTRVRATHRRSDGQGNGCAGLGFGLLPPVCLHCAVLHVRVVPRVEPQQRVVHGLRAKWPPWLLQVCVAVVERRRDAYGDGLAQRRRVDLEGRCFPCAVWVLAACWCVAAVAAFSWLRRGKQDLVQARATKQ